MSGLAKYGDLTMGMGTHGKKKCPHSFLGMVISGSPDVMTNNLATGRIGDTTIHFCPHCSVGMLIGGSPNIFTNNIPNHRLGDVVTEFCGMGFTLTGSGDTLANSFNK